MKLPSHAEVVRALLAWERAITRWEGRVSANACVQLVIADRRLKHFARRLRKGAK